MGEMTTINYEGNIPEARFQRAMTRMRKWMLRVISVLAGLALIGWVVSVAFPSWKTFSMGFGLRKLVIGLRAGNISIAFKNDDFFGPAWDTNLFIVATILIFLWIIVFTLFRTMKWGRSQR